MDRPDEKRIIESPSSSQSRKPKDLWRQILLIGAILLIFYFGLGAAIAWNTVQPKYHPPIETPAAWNLKYQDIHFVSSDGTKLVGWYIPANRTKPKGVIILCHGLDASKGQMLSKAAFLHKAGYSTLLFDFRARGESGGGKCTMGYRETDDLIAAANWVETHSISSKSPIGVLGISLGGAIALRGTARCPKIKAVVAEASFAQLDHAVSNHFQQMVGFMAPVLCMPTVMMGERMIGTKMSSISPMSDIGKIAPRPVFLIADGADDLCPPSETELLMQAAGIPKSIWTVPNAGHASGQNADKQEYIRRVVAFFDANLNDEGK